MITFSVRFKVRSLELDAIVTASDHHEKFKVELITGEPNPIWLTRSANGNWNIKHPGLRNLAEHEFILLEKTIDDHLDKLYGAKKVLIVTDFSDDALKTCEYVAGLTHQLKSSTLILYHSIDNPSASAFNTPKPPLSEKESFVNLTALKNKLKPLVSEQTMIDIIADTRSWISAINTLAEEQEIGLVATSIDMLNIVKDCNTPVLAVPDHIEFKKIERVVFACDVENIAATMPADAIKTFLHTLGVKVLFLYVKTEIPADEDTDPQMNTLHELWDLEKPVYHFADQGDFEKGMMDFSDTNHIELIIMVTKEYALFDQTYHHNIHLNSATPIPMLIFKEDI